MQEYKDGKSSLLTTSLNYLTLGEGKCVPQMQSTIHVWEREGAEELFIRTLPGFKWSIHFIYLCFFPSSLNILLNLLKVFDLESTLSIKGRGLQIKPWIKVCFCYSHAWPDITLYNDIHNTDIQILYVYWDVQIAIPLPSVSYFYK